MLNIIFIHQRQGFEMHLCKDDRNTPCQGKNNDLTPEFNICLCKNDKNTPSMLEYLLCLGKHNIHTPKS